MFYILILIYSIFPLISSLTLHIPFYFYFLSPLFLTLNSSISLHNKFIIHYEKVLERIR